MTMQKALFSKREPQFLLMTGVLLLLFIISGFMYQQKRSLQQQNRQLIIENDSIRSVNILLEDSVKQRSFSNTVKSSSPSLKLD